MVNYNFKTPHNDSEELFPCCWWNSGSLSQLCGEEWLLCLLTTQFFVNALGSLAALHLPCPPYGLRHPLPVLLGAVGALVGKRILPDSYSWKGNHTWIPQTLVLMRNDNQVQICFCLHVSVKLFV